MNEDFDGDEENDKTFGDNLESQGGDNEGEENESGGDLLNDSEKQEGQGGSPLDTVKGAKDGIDTATKTADMARKGADAAKAAQTGSTAAGAASGAAGGAAASASVGIWGWVLLIVIILIVLIGFIMFFILMPGMVMNKIKEFADNFFGWCMEKLSGAENVIKEEEIAEVANYLENMGYDLKGYGFVTGDVDEETIKEKNKEMLENKRTELKDLKDSFEEKKKNNELTEEEIKGIEGGIQEREESIKRLEKRVFG